MTHIGRSDANYSHYMEGMAVQCTAEEKDLGLYVAWDTSPRVHTSKAAAKANAVLGRVTTTFTCMAQDRFLAFYLTLVRPHME